MDVLFREGQGTVSDVQKAMPDPPSYSSCCGARSRSIRRTR